MWGYLEYRGVFSTVGDIISSVGVILNTVLDTQYHWGYLDECGDIMSSVEGGVQYRGGTILCNLSTVGDIMIHVDDIISTVGVFSTVGYSNNKRFPPTLMNTPMVLTTVLMISPMVLNTPTVLKISPHLS